MPDLASMNCVPCRGEVPPLTHEQIMPLLALIGDEWRVVDDHHIEKAFRFSDFKKALAFTNDVGALAEAQGHHPEIGLGWGHADITIWTHKVDGLTESDFVLAAKIDRLYSPSLETSSG